MRFLKALVHFIRKDKKFNSDHYFLFTTITIELFRKSDFHARGGKVTNQRRKIEGKKQVFI